MRERSDDADVHEPAAIVVEAEQQRAHRPRVGLVRPVAGHHAVRRSDVLDLEHHPFVRLVGPLERLGDDAVEPRALELVEPPLRHLGIVGGRGEVDRRLRAGQRLLEHAASLAERLTGEVAVAEREQVERDEVRRGALGEQLDPALGRVDPLLQGLEVEPPARGSGTTISPSSTQRSGRPALIADTTSGK